MSESVWEKIEPLAPDIGVTKDALRKARERGRVPYKWRLPLLRAAANKGKSLTAEELEAA